MLIFLVIIFLGANIGCGVLAAITLKHVVFGKFYFLTCRAQLIGQTSEEAILSGIHMCNYNYEGDVQLLISMFWTLNYVWEVLALCLSVWIAVKHFRNLRRLGSSTGSMIGDCFKVLIKSHVLYFAR
jgi:glycerol-3-phosphate acyltransferase PlsY